MNASSSNKPGSINLKKESKWLQQIDDISNIEFNQKKIEKLNKIARQNKKLHSIMQAVRLVIKQRQETCHELRSDVNQFLLLKTNFKFIQALTKGRAINKRILSIIKKDDEIRKTLNLTHKSEDYIRYLLSQLRDNFSRIQSEILKTNDVLGIKLQKKINLELNATLMLIKSGKSKLDQGSFENLKNLFIQICAKLKFWCKTMPIVVVGVACNEALFVKIQKKLKHLIKVNGAEHFFTSDMRKLAHYQQVIKKANYNLNFYEIAKGGDDFLITAGDIQAWYKWNTFAGKQIKRFSPTIKSSWVSINNDYNAIYMKIVEEAAGATKQPELVFIKEFPVMLRNQYDVIKKQYVKLFGEGNSNKNNALTATQRNKTRDLFYIGVWKKTRQFVQGMDQFVEYMDQINNRSNLCSYYIHFIKNTANTTRQYIIYIVNNLVKFRMENREKLVEKLQVYDATLCQIAQNQKIVSFKNLRKLFLRSKEIQNKVLFLYSKTEKIKKDTKMLGDELLWLNYQAEKFYSTRDYSLKIKKGIGLYEQGEYIHSMGIVKQLNSK